MKKILLLFSLFAFCNVKAQKTQWLLGLNADSAKILTDSIISNIQSNQFVFQNADFLKEKPHKYIVSYINSSKTGEDAKLDFLFDVRYGRYYLMNFSNKNLDPFDFWNHYVDRTISYESFHNDPSISKNIYYPGKDYYRTVQLEKSDDGLQYSVTIFH